MPPAMSPGDEVLTSRENPLFKRLAALKRTAGADEELLLVEGPRLLREALDAPLTGAPAGRREGRRAARHAAAAGGGRHPEPGQPRRAAAPRRGRGRHGGV